MKSLNQVLPSFLCRIGGIENSHLVLRSYEVHQRQFLGSCLVCEAQDTEHKHNFKAFSYVHEQPYVAFNSHKAFLA